MARTESVDVATWTLLLTGLVVALLLVTGLVQYTASGDLGSVFRNVGIGGLLVAFSVGLSEKWRDS